VMVVAIWVWDRLLLSRAVSSTHLPFPFSSFSPLQGRAGSVEVVQSSLHQSPPSRE
jgi:hypothetical protein